MQSQDGEVQLYLLSLSRAHAAENPHIGRAVSLVVHKFYTKYSESYRPLQHAATLKGLRHQGVAGFQTPVDSP